MTEVKKEILIVEFVKAIRRNEMTLEQVPEVYRSEVKEALEQ